jgi:hypothetical protein
MVMATRNGIVKKRLTEYPTPELRITPTPFRDDELSCQPRTDPRCSVAPGLARIRSEKDVGNGPHGARRIGIRLEGRMWWDVHSGGGTPDDRAGFGKDLQDEHRVTGRAVRGNQCEGGEKTAPSELRERERGAPIQLKVEDIGTRNPAAVGEMHRPDEGDCAASVLRGSRRIRRRGEE